jgi:Zn-dependent peptidase ImmA (M78 family)
MLNVFLEIRKLLPSLNKKRITWRMIVRAVNKLKAKLFCIPMQLDGYFIPPEISRSGRPEIYVNARLAEDLQIATAVHELKHARFDTLAGSVLYSFREAWTTATRRHLEKWRQYEYEACAMGALALLPKQKLKHAGRGLFDPEDDFLDEIWRIRFDLRERFPALDRA